MFSDKKTNLNYIEIVLLRSESKKSIESIKFVKMIKK